MIGWLSLNCRALFSRNAHGPITGLRAHYRMWGDHFRRARFGFLALFLCAIIINNLITSAVRSLRENLKPRSTVLTSLSLGQYGEASVWDLPVTTSLAVTHSQTRGQIISCHVADVSFCYSRSVSKKEYILWITVILLWWFGLSSRHHWSLDTPSFKKSLILI